jgi:hypothetical protein
MTCLRQALAADAMLRRYGFASQLRLGVQRHRGPSSTSLQSHAWVECDGAIVVGGIEGLADYAVLDRTRSAVGRATGAPAIPGQVLSAIASGDTVAWPTLGVTPGEFLEACASEDLIGLVHQRMPAWSDAGGWPATLCADLAQRARGEAARELVRRNELISVLQALADADVHPILLKGTPVAYEVYSAPASRPRLDTDLLIRREALGRARDAMTNLGYTAPTQCDGELLFCQFALARDDHFGVEHVFDFHWKISTQSVFADVLTYDELAAGAVPVPALGPHARAAGPVHALLLACLHPVMHHRNIERLIWIYDVHLLASRLSAAELGRFAELAIAKRVGAVCAHGLAIARSRCGTRIPDHVMRRLDSAGNEPSAAYLEPGRRWRHEFVASVRALRRWKDRLRLVSEVLVPGPRYMMGAYGVRSRALGFALLPALYVHRNVHGIWKVLAGRK